MFYSSSDLFGMETLPDWMENSCFVHNLVSLKSGDLYKIELCTRKPYKLLKHRLTDTIKSQFTDISGVAVF